MNNFEQDYESKKSFLGKFKLRTQMLFGYAIPVVFFIGSTAVVYTNANKVFLAFDKVETVQKSIIEVDKLAVAGSNMVANNRAYLISPGQDFIDLYEASWKNFQDASKNLEDVITDPIQKERFEAIAQQILRLSEQTNQIGTISQLVSDLANQTNMLALNAAVEAVRAGEYGKGFSVVASEIRKLADESKKSADKINNLVAEIKQSTSITVMVTEEGIKSVEKTEDFAQKTASSFGNMADEINNIVINSQQIAMNSKQQALAIQQVVTAMNNLNQNAKDSNNGMGQIKTGIQKLNHAAMELKAIVQEG